MSDFSNITKHLNNESSLLSALLIVCGTTILCFDSKSIMGCVVMTAAIVTVILGFIVNSIRENYTDIIKQKNEMIKTLTKDRKDEIEHSRSIREHSEKQMNGGWKSSTPDNDII